MSRSVENAILELARALGVSAPKIRCVPVTGDGSRSWRKGHVTASVVSGVQDKSKGDFLLEITGTGADREAAVEGLRKELDHRITGRIVSLMEDSSSASERAERLCARAEELSAVLARMREVDVSDRRNDRGDAPRGAEVARLMREHGRLMELVALDLTPELCVVTGRCEWTSKIVESLPGVHGDVARDEDDVPMVSMAMVDRLALCARLEELGRHHDAAKVARGPEGQVAQPGASLLVICADDECLAVTWSRGAR